MEKRTYRLPTEAEWEYACRAGTTTAFYCGDNPEVLGEYAWYGKNAHELDEPYAHPVGLKNPNSWGLYDMMGNVEEWCQDWYGNYPSKRVADPTGPKSGNEDNYKIARGGSFWNDPNYLRSGERMPPSPEAREDCYGFRVVLVGTKKTTRPNQSIFK
jgi:formylglycine-generating enzyme required for sulfatase activity